MEILRTVLITAALTASPLVLAGGQWDSQSSASSASSASSGAAQAPEMDVAGAGIAFGLVLAVTALIRERRTRK